MKPIVLALLLANILFLAWTQWIAPREEPAPAPRDDVPEVRLASDPGRAPSQGQPVPSQPMPGTSTPASDAQGGDAAGQDESANLAADPSTPATPDPEVLTSVTRCVSIGAFRTLAEATQASAALRSAGHEPRTRVSEGDVWAGLWVSLQNLPSRAEAQRAVNLLKQRGVADAYLMPAAGGAPEISLGIFSDPARAQKRADDVRALGFTPSISDRTRRGAVYWIDVDLEPTDGFINPADLQGESGRIVRLEVEACPAAS
jgi:hypothetical protein